MSIRFECPDCGSVLKIKEALAGTEGKCPKCKRPFTVPEASTSVAAAVPDADTSPGAIDAGTIASPPKSKGKAKVATPAADDADFDPVAFLMEGGASKAKAKSSTSGPGPSPSDRGGLSLDDGDPGPETKPGPKPAERPPAPARTPTAAASAGGLLSASSNAKDLLTRTVEESRARAAEMPNESKVPFIDTEQLKMLLFTRILPIGGALVVGCWLLYLLANSMYGTDGAVVPEELVAAEGVVLINGQPTAGVQVSMRFMPPADDPNAEPWRASTAVTNEDGEFEMIFIDGYEGVVPGRQRVSLSYMVEGLETINSDFAEPGKSMPIEEGTYDLKLESTAVIPQPREAPPDEEGSPE